MQKVGATQKNNYLYITVHYKGGEDTPDHCCCTLQVALLQFAEKAPQIAVHIKCFHTSWPQLLNMTYQSEQSSARSILPFL